MYLGNIYQEKETSIRLSQIFDENYKKTAKTTPLIAETYNTNAVKELEIFKKMFKFQSIIFDYFQKQMYGE